MYRICIIEDDEIQCRELKRMLENSLYQALVPEISGREGAGLEEYLLEEIRTGGPDLILLDIELPGLDGVALCRRIRDFSTARFPEKAGARSLRGRSFASAACCSRGQDRLCPERNCWMICGTDRSLLMTIR